MMTPARRTSLLKVLFVVEVADRVRDQAAEVLELGERMPGDVEAEGVLLVGKHQRLIPFAHVLDLGRDFGRLDMSAAEKRGSAGSLLAFWLSCEKSIILSIR